MILYNGKFVTIYQLLFVECTQTLTTVLYNCKAPFTLEIYFEICEKGVTVFSRLKSLPY